MRLGSKAAVSRPAPPRGAWRGPRSDLAPKSLRARAAGAFRLATLAIVALSGCALAGGGAELAGLGGSLYYLFVGLALVACAVLLWRRPGVGAALYGLVFLATAAWSLAEVGLDGWALMPRLVFQGALGLCVASPAVRAPGRPGGRWFARLLASSAAVAVLLLVGAVAATSVEPGSAPPARRAPALASGAAPAAGGDWTSYGRTLQGTRYSPLAEITPGNVRSLKRAWTYRTGLRNPAGKRPGGLEFTPVLADGRLYGCTAFSSVFALDPVTGRQLWRRDLGVPDDSGGHPVCRGVSFFRAPAGGGDCPIRLLVGTPQNRLVALDAATGAFCKGFGEGGQVDLNVGLGPHPHRWAHPTSPPAIVNGVAVIGAYVVDNRSTEVPSGVVRGYDAVTGRLRWAFDPGRPDAHGPPPAGGRYTPATPNSWSVASGDEARGLVYLPMGNGSPDLYGGARSAETERFSSAVVALDAATGAVRWTFQAVHHDLWDYDIAAQPVLADVPTPAGPVPGLILATKGGQIFLLDRRTGVPLSPVAERPVPRSDVPGERSAPTQPVSAGMPDFAGPPLSEADMWGLTPFDQLWCRVRFRQARYRGVFTPPRLGASIRYPGELGGIDWGSVSVDESRGILLVNSNHMADHDELITRRQFEREGLVTPVGGDAHSAPVGPMTGTPYAVHWGPFLTALGVPCQRPPYGDIAAVDLKTRKVLWRQPLGDARNSGPFGIGLRLPLPLGAPNIGGSVATRGGLVFIAATQDEMFRALDVMTGRVLWQDRLPVAGHATPMSFLGRDGHQYVVIAAGGGALKDRLGDYLIAYRLQR